MSRPDPRFKPEDVVNPTPEEYAKLNAFRAWVMEISDVQAQIDGGYKGDEGIINAIFPRYPMYDHEALDKGWGEYKLYVYSYLYGPGRHHEWSGKSLGECVDQARADFEQWIKDESAKDE